MRKLLQFKDGINDFDIEIRGSRVVIRGESSTGKSLLVDALKSKKAYVMSFKKPDPMDFFYSMEIFDYMRADLAEIKSFKNKFIVIDNADEILLNNMEAIETINVDSNNRYIILGRSIGKLYIQPNYIGHLENVIGRDCNTIKLVYDYTERSWW